MRRFLRWRDTFIYVLSGAWSKKNEWISSFFSFFCPFLAQREMQRLSLFLIDPGYLLSELLGRPWQAK
jgi:hypothetical protein